jgi:hypothetical protein
MNETEVRDHLTLVFLVAELSKKSECLLEVLHRGLFGTPLGESQGEIVQRHGLPLMVPEVTKDGERHTMLRSCLFVVAATSKLRATLVEAERTAPPPDGRHSLVERRDQPAAGVDKPRRQRRRPVDRSRVALTTTSYEGMRAIGSLIRHGAGLAPGTPSAFANAELMSSRPQALEGSADRFQGGRQRLIDRNEGSARRVSHWLAAQQPDASDDDRNENQDGSRDEDDDDEGERSQQSGQEDPERGEREQAAAPLLTIRCHRRARSFTTRSPSGTAALRLAEPSSCLPAAASRTNHRKRSPPAATGSVPRLPPNDF